MRHNFGEYLSFVAMKLPGILYCRDWLCEDGASIHVTGGIPQLGNWQQEDSYPLTEVNSPVWEGEVLQLGIDFLYHCGLYTLCDVCTNFGTISWVNPICNVGYWI